MPLKTTMSAEEVDLIRAGRPIDAIKAMRARLGPTVVGLAEAKREYDRVRAAIEAGETVVPAGAQDRIAPLVHLNGTGRDGLMRGYREAARTLRAAVEALQQTAPHGRDYDCHPLTPQLGEGAPLKLATEEHRARLQALEGVLFELEQLGRAVYAQGAQ